MNEIKQLVSGIPDGKKIEALGSLYFKGLTNYYDAFGDDEIDLDELVVKNFKSLIQRDNIIGDIILFASDKIKSITNYPADTTLSDKNNIKTHLIDYFEITFEEDVTEPRNIEEESNCQIKLHDFQDRIRRKVINLIFNNQKRFLIHMPTGSGQTRTAAEILIDFIRLSSSRALLTDKLKILWIAQSSELCFQAYETVKWLFEQKGTQDIKIGHFYDSQTLSEGIENEPAIIFCGIQQLLLHYKEPIWQQIKNDNYLVVVDEAHRSVAKQWVQALDNFVSNSSVYLLGLTATPGIGLSDDDRSYSLSTYYHSNKISITDEKYTEIPNPISHLVEREFLAKINRIDIDSEIVSPDNATETDGEFKFTKKTLKYLSTQASRNSSILNIIKNNHQDNKILVFTCGLEHNRILKTLLTEAGIVSETVDQGTNNRNSIINRFKDGDLNILLNFGVLTTGFDAPKTNICIIARPISSIVMYSQMVGRILRGPKNTGNYENTLYTIKDNLGHGGYDDLFNSFNYFYK